jgi:tRNA(Arg) A34 adenosine deaminase TadA
MPLCPGSQTDWRGVAAPPRVELSAREMEQHSIYLLLAMALVFDSWCVNKTRPEQAQAYAEGERERIFDEYLGHNVGALVVDPREGILSFALNRTVELRSTLEHAEARAIRHAINRRNKTRMDDYDLWSFTTLLKGSRLYATLEPCSQCAGIVELANLESIIYSQDDPFQCGIVNVLYKLHLHLRPVVASSPLPIRATFFPFWDDLSAAHADFVASKPSHGRTGLTSFLETFQAYAIYRKAAVRLDGMVVEDPENTIILERAQSFREDWGSKLQSGLAPL